MEHIVQFGVSIDDKTIEERVIRSATDEVLGIVKRTAKGSTSWDSNGFIKQLMKEEVKKIIDDNKPEIIDYAIKELAKNMIKTKAVKEAVANVVKDIKDV